MAENFNAKQVVYLLVCRLTSWSGIVQLEFDVDLLQKKPEEVVAAIKK